MLQMISKSTRNLNCFNISTSCHLCSCHGIYLLPEINLKSCRAGNCERVHQCVKHSFEKWALLQTLSKNIRANLSFQKRSRLKLSLFRKLYLNNKQKMLVHWLHMKYQRANHLQKFHPRSRFYFAATHYRYWKRTCMETVLYAGKECLISISQINETFEKKSKRFRTCNRKPYFFI